MAAAFIPLTIGKSPIVPSWLGGLSVLFFVEQGLPAEGLPGQAFPV